MWENLYTGCCQFKSLYIQGGIKAEEDEWETDEAADEEQEQEEGKEDEGASEEIQNAVKGIDKAFREVDVSALPHPGDKVAKSSSSAQLHVSG